MLLTDCHMPQMDGYELARAIRSHEKGSADRFPIVAVTASALQKEAEYCFAAGMDDYISKPFSIRSLGTVIRKWIPSVPSATAGLPIGTDDSRYEPASDAREDHGPIDMRAARKILGDDPDTIKEVMIKFMDSAPGIFADLQASSAIQSGGGLEGAAHKLKSAARTIGALALGDALEDMEAAAGSGDWTAVAKILPLVNSGFESVVEQIKELTS
jgi:HPt (histidine-containing phosphotransfer) domain-containing protein